MMALARWKYPGLRFNRIHTKTYALKTIKKSLKVALYSFLGTQRIGTNGTSPRVFKKNVYLMMSLKQGSLSDLKTHIRRVPDGEFFFYHWHVDRLFLSLAVRKKSSNSTHTLMQYASKTKIANSSKIYAQIFL